MRCFLFVDAVSMCASLRLCRGLLIICSKVWDMEIDVLFNSAVYGRGAKLQIFEVYL